MKREFLLNIFFLVFINLLVKPFFIFGIDLEAQNRVGPEAYGLYFALMSLTFVFQMLNDFGIQNFASAHIARDPSLLPLYLPSLLAMKGILSFAYFFLTLAAATALGHPIEHFALLGCLALNQILSSLVLFLRANIAAMGRYRTDSFLSSLDRLLAIALMSILLWARPFSSVFRIEELAMAQTFSLLLTVGVCFWALSGSTQRLRWHFEKGLFWTLLKKSAPYALLVLLMSATSRIDVILLERLRPDGQQQAGIYGNAYRLLDAANMVGYLFATLLLPMFSRLLSEKKPVQPLLSLAFRLALAGAAPLCATIFFNRMAISAAMNDRSDAFWGNALGTLIWVFLPTCTAYTFGALLSASERLRPLSQLFAIGLALNIGLNLAFLPSKGALGAAQAAVLTQSAMAIGLFFIAKKSMGLQFSARSVLSGAAFLAAALGAAHWASELQKLSVFEKSALSFALGGLSAFLTGWLSARPLAAAIKAKSFFRPRSK